MSNERCIIFRNNFMTVSEMNPIILLNGETAIEIDNTEKVVRIKIGNNVSTYSELPFYKVGYGENIENIVDIINDVLSHYNMGVQSISISGGSENGTIKLIVNDVEYDNIKVTGLGSAAYTAVSNYATYEQGVKADNAMPKSGGRFTGPVYLNQDPVNDYEASTKHYVDLKTGIKSDSMVYKGTIGDTGTLREIPYLNVNSGDTYRIVSPLMINNNKLGIGDLIVAKVNGPSILWEVIPANITTVKLSSTDVNVNTTEKSGSIILGYAASKQVASNVDNGSEDLVTAKQVKDYVSGLTNSMSDVVKTIPTSNEKIYITGTPSSIETTGTERINRDVFINSDNQIESIAGFKGPLEGVASKANELVRGIKTTLNGGANGTSNVITGKNGNTTMNIFVKNVNTDYLVNGNNTLVLDCGNANYE